jgi:hypothetical protein
VAGMNTSGSLAGLIGKKKPPKRRPKGKGKKR